ncbi:MAG: ABC transporter substrate-binding protein [Armatimonadota bacterium]|nr:ABC transporter substrate-binding protein [Armatimonadota bacterium]
MRWRLVLFLLAAVGMMVALPTAAQVSEIPVGIIYPRTGELARLGETVVQASLMAADDINNAGGIKSLGGARIRPIVADNRSDATIQRTETERLITRYRPVAINGSYASSLTLVGTEVAERLKVPWVTGSIADPITGRGFKYVFQVSPKASMFGKMQVDFAAELLKQARVAGKRKVAILYEDTAYGTSTSKGLLDRSKELGLDVALYEAYKAGITDAAPLVTKVKASGADILFPVSYLTDAILLIKTLKEQGVNVVVIGGGAGYLMPEFYQGLGKLAEGVFSVGSWNWDLPYKPIKDVAERYKRRTGEFIQEHAGEGYAIMWIIANALERARSTDPQKVRDALAKTDLKPPHPGAIMPGGCIKFDSTGWNTCVHPVMVQWQDGELRTVWPPNVATVKARLPW